MTILEEEFGMQKMEANCTIQRYKNEIYYAHAVEVQGLNLRNVPGTIARAFLAHTKYNSCHLFPFGNGWRNIRLFDELHFYKNYCDKFEIWE